MSKPYTETNHSDQLNCDLTWRLKEISDLKSAALRADQRLQRVLLRALVAICYAHWEGFVKFASHKYLEHVALRKLALNELDRQFWRNHFLSRLAALSVSRASVSERAALIDAILAAGSERFSRVNDDLVSTRSNLNSDVIADIGLVCGISAQPFADEATFIDKLLLKRRNAIAHGEEAYIVIEDADGLAKQTIGLMRAFSTALENNVYVKAFRANPH